MTDRELMQEALYALTYVGDAKEIYSDTIESLRARLAQPEQEPVAWMHIQGDHQDPCFRELTEDEISRGWTQEPLYFANGSLKP